VFDVPRTNGLELTVIRDPKARDPWLATGKTQLLLPGLEPADLSVTYDGEHLTGSARVAVATAGVTGHLMVVFADGQFSGEGAP
jgi:hypothetical protein